MQSPRPPTAQPARPSGAPAGWLDGQLETLKWIALASMFVDHVGRFLLGFGNESWVFAGGRLAFPLFAFVLGMNLAREGDRAGRAARTALRLALWCAVSVLPSIWMRGDPWVVNVLGTLSLGAAACWALAASAHPALRALVLAGAALGALRVEFGVPGTLLVAGVYLAATRATAVHVLAAAALLLLVGWNNASFGGWPALLGTLAAAPVAAAVAALPLRMPRLKLAFYLVYPLHLALIGALKEFG